MISSKYDEEYREKNDIEQTPDIQERPHPALST